MKFSICSPTWYNKEHDNNKRQPRYEFFLRCANSVFGQTFDDFEWIIADDICTPPVEEILEQNDSWCKPKGMQVKIIRLPEKSGRIVARNAAMKAATGDWITWLDADDEYASICLEALSKAIDTYPSYDMFNFNHLIFSYNFGTTVRKFIDMDKVGDRPFGSGTVGAGSYIFKRTLFEEVGPIPEQGLWDLAAWAFDKFPETKQFFWNDEKKGYNSLGNPWGEDWLYFYMLTRKAKCKYLDTALYYVHSHYGHRWPESPDFAMGEEKGPTWTPENR